MRPPVYLGSLQASAQYGRDKLRARDLHGAVSSQGKVTEQIKPSTPYPRITHVICLIASHSPPEGATEVAERRGPFC